MVVFKTGSLCVHYLLQFMREGVTRHYPLQRQLEHGTTNRLLLHLLIRHIILSNHLLHSATRIPPSATFWKLYLLEQLSPSARTSIRCKPNLYLLDTIFT